MTRSPRDQVSGKEREMQRRHFGWVHPLRRFILTALTAGMPAIVGGCTGTIGPMGGGGGPAGGNTGAGVTTATGVGAGAGSGSAGVSGSAGAGNTTVTGAAGAGGAGSPPAVFAPSPGAYRRLTATAFRNSLRDLLQGPVTVGTLEPDSWSIGGFASVSAATVSISAAGVEQYQAAIDAATTDACADSTRRSKVLGCTPKSATDTACFQSFVTRFGRLAWRQPLTPAQVTRYTTLIANVAATLGDVNEGMRAGLQGLLLSPNFLYRIERGAPGTSSAFWHYTSSEVATRLAYFLTNSTPDSTLLDLAGQDGLETKEAILAQADRLLGTAAGRESVGNFASELYQLQIIASRAKDPKFTDYTPALQTAMMQEIPAMFQSIVLDRNASALELLTTRNTFVNKELAALYGLPTTGLSSTSLAAATLPASSQRAGLLTTAGF